LVSLIIFRFYKRRGCYQRLPAGATGEMVLARVPAPDQAGWPARRFAPARRMS